MRTYNILSIDEFKTKIGNNSRLLGIDPGNKNVGFAICDENQKVATPFKVIEKRKFETFVFKTLVMLKEPLLESLSSHSVIGIVIYFDKFLAKSIDD